MGLTFLSDKNVRGEFFKRYSAAEAGSWASRLGMRVSSDQEVESYKWLGMPPIMREWLGGRQEGKLREEAYTITNKPFEATLAIDEHDMRRDRLGQIEARIADMAARAAQHWEKLLHDLIIADGLCYDGQNFFDTDHVSGDSGTLKNELTASEVAALNVTTPTAPTATEMANIIVGLIQYMYGYKDDTGEPINQNAREFIVMVPATFMASTLTALSAQFLTSGVSNPVVANSFRIEALVNPRITTTTIMYMFRADGMLKPFIMQEEVPIRFRTKDELFENHRMLYGVDSVRNVGYGMWQHAVKATLS